MEDFDKTVENLEKKNKEFNFHELKTGELNYENSIKNFLKNILKINLNLVKSLYPILFIYSFENKSLN